MVPGYSGAEDTLVSDTMVFCGTVWKLECFYWNFRLCRFKQSHVIECRRCIVVLTPFAGRGDGQVIQSQSLMRKRDIVSRMNGNSTLRDREVTT